MGNVIYLQPPVKGIMRAVKTKPCALPFFLSTVPAGFPSPAEDYMEERLDIGEYLIARPAATYFVRVKGDSMTGVGIHDGALLVVDRSITPQSGHIVLAVINGEVTVKRLIREGGRYYLKPENPKYAIIEVPDGSELMVWGVVLHAIIDPR